MIKPSRVYKSIIQRKRQNEMISKHITDFMSHPRHHQHHLIKCYSTLENLKCEETEHYLFRCRKSKWYIGSCTDS